MPTTAIWGVITFLAVLGPLILLHEFGHFLAARLTGTKVLEFGIGYPPRLAGLWTGRTEVCITPGTRFDMEGGAGALAPGVAVSIAASREADGSLLAHRVRDLAGSRADAGTCLGARTPVVGKIREVKEGSIVVAEMLWSVNLLLPLGGFTRMLGEEDPRAEGSLASKSRRQRVLVLIAGSLVNAVIPFALFPLVLMFPQGVTVGDVTVLQVMPGSPAEVAGLRDGDRIVRVDGRAIENIPDLQGAVTLRLGAESRWEVQRAVADPHPQPGSLPYQYRPGLETVTVVPRWKPPRRELVREVEDPRTQVSLSQARAYDPGLGLASTLRVVQGHTDVTGEISLADAWRYLGSGFRVGDVLSVVVQVSDPLREVSLADARRYDPELGLATVLVEGAVGVTITSENVRVESRGLPFWEAVPAGFRSVVDTLVITKNAIFAKIVGSSNPQFSGPVGIGPVGIGQLTGEIATADASRTAKAITLMNLAGLISISLAVLNILPIPALDGGRLVFVAIEWVRGGRRVSPEREGLVHLVGFAILLGIAAIVSVQDILRIFRGESFF
ncbi:MAG: site-2 protease family protein [Gemmatimonadetes bacterium]|nr:site-2 protease family protein [Gemmatimonadota bacterium]